MQIIIEEAIQALGWGLLKLVSLGSYRRAGTHAQLAEGAIGLLTVAVISWAIYRIWS